MSTKISCSKLFTLLACLSIVFMVTACGTTLRHVPSQSLNGMAIQKPASVMVADLGDVRIGESPDRVGQGVSYWLPSSYYARDSEGKKLSVSYYIAQSLCEDLGRLGYRVRMANEDGVRASLSLDEAVAIAKKSGVDYLVTTKVNDGKTNYWGFLIIPFVEPVWTRIDFDSQLIDLKTEKGNASFRANRSKTEWYFGKILVLDSIFDAGIFGGHWVSTAWGNTVVPAALAETAQQISAKIQAQ